jgi:hypothetical protein
MSQIALNLTLHEAAFALSALRGVNADALNLDSFHLLSSVIENLQSRIDAANTNVPDNEPFDGFRTDTEADADALASAGYGTDEDYGNAPDPFFDPYWEH